MSAAPDYKALYFELFRASEQAARLLQEAQQHAEEQVMEADAPPLRLPELPLHPCSKNAVPDDEAPSALHPQERS